MASRAARGIRSVGTSSASARAEIALSGWFFCADPTRSPRLSVMEARR